MLFKTDNYPGANAARMRLAYLLMSNKLLFYRKSLTSGAKSFVSFPWFNFAPVDGENVIS